jgi:hypothetical protein
MMEIRSMSMANQIRHFNGEGNRKFHDWLKDMTRVCTALRADPERTRALALQTVTGPAAEFLTRYLTTRPTADWPVIKAAMAARYSDEADATYALQKLRTLKQNSGEPVQNYVERILSFSGDAYVGQDINNQFIQQQLVQTFIDGVKDEFMAKKLIRERPQTLDAALTIAISELQTSRSFALRRNLWRWMPFQLGMGSRAK